VNQTEQVNEEGEYLLMKQSLESLDLPLFYPSNSEIERWLNRKITLCSDRGDDPYMLIDTRETTSFPYP